jgi:pimeloyl-ACP methyl ester carboxylesterase/DNA-binding CsgD family transcriptional regulator
MTPFDQKIHELIDLIYETALEPEHWPELLNGVAELADGACDEGGDASLLERRSSTSISHTLKQLPANLHEPASAADSRTMLNQVLSRHFVRALNVARRLSELEEHSRVVGSFLDRLPVALVLVNGDGEIIECNQQAKNIFEQDLPLTNRQGRLQVKDWRQGKALSAALRKIVSQRDYGDDQVAFVIKAKREADDLVVALSPLWQQHAALSPAVAIFVSQRKSQHISLPASVTNLYGFTDKETKVAELLIHGYNVAEIADMNNVSEHTVRSQIKSLLGKTDSRRQTELVSLLLTGPGSMMGMGASVEAADNSRMHQRAPSDCRRVELQDGRILAYQEYGDPDGAPLLFFHSALGSRLELAFNGHEKAVQRGFRIIAPDRPGFGESCARDDHSFCHWADDVKQLADHLELDKFCIAGYAIGGLFALACAQAMPDRVSQLSLIGSGVTLQSKADFEHTTPLYRMNLKLARDLPAVHRMLVSITRKSVLQNPERFFNLLASRLGQADADTFANPVFRKQYYAAITECARQGPDAHAHEVQMLMQPWGFDPRDTKTPCHLWHGKQDVHVPFITGQRLAQQLPFVSEHYLDDEGHFLFYHHWGSILDAVTSEGGCCGLERESD